MTWIDKLKKRWGVRSVWDVMVILVVFACTGFSIVYIKHLFGINAETQMGLRIAFYLFVLFLYQIILLIYGALFGKFRFFWEFEKRMFKRIFDFIVRKKS
jgi:hypothetical protein